MRKVVIKQSLSLTGIKQCEFQFDLKKRERERENSEKEAYIVFQWLGIPLHSELKPLIHLKISEILESVLYLKKKMICHSSAAERVHRMYPSQCNKIEPGLYLGGLDAAEQIETLRHLKITHVLTVASFPITRTAAYDVQSLFIEAEDWDDENLLSSFPRAINFIKEGQQNGTCLVHCLAGISRSATLVIAFLMQKYGVSLTEALKKVEEKRPCINPNEGFLNQLKLFEAMKCTIDTENIGYKIFALHHLRKRITERNFEFIHKYLEEFMGNKLHGGQIKCKQCRQYLCSESNMIPHFEGKDLCGLDIELQYYQSSASYVCKSTLLVEPLSWMTDISHALEGKLYCPKCLKKIGTFHWEGKKNGFGITPL